MRPESRLRGARFVGYLVTVIGLGAAISFVVLLGQVLVIPNAGVLYLLVVIASAYWLGTGPAILGVVVSLVTITLQYQPVDPSLAAFVSRFAIIMAALVFGVILARLARRAEADRTRLLVEAGRRAAELDAAFGAIPDALVVYGPDGEIAYANRATERMLGAPTDVFRAPLSVRLTLLRVETPGGLPIAPEDSPSARALRGETIQGQAFVLRDRHGKQIWVSASAAPIRATGGEIVGAVLTFADVTELHEFQIRQEEMLSMVSHDLRAPLTLILGQGQILERLLASSGSDTLAERSARSIVAGARRMNRMIQDLVDSTRLETGEVGLHLGSIDLRQALLGLLERMAAARTAGVERIQVDAPEGLPRVLADPDRLERVLSNLLSNAVKYSEAGTLVVVRLAESDGEVITSVTDQGYGISPEELPKLFEKYYRTRTGREDRDSLGLGLYIARRLVEAMGGRIWVESRRDAGSTFSFSLPEESRSDDS